MKFQYLKHSKSSITADATLSCPAVSPETAISRHERYQFIAYSTKVMVVHGGLGYTYRWKVQKVKWLYWVIIIYLQYVWMIYLSPLNY
jgi:hypothetical protein